MRRLMPGRQKRTLLALLGLALAATTGLTLVIFASDDDRPLLSAAKTPSPDPGAAEREETQGPSFSVDYPAPIPGGEAVPSTVATALLIDCECPQLPPEGEMSASNVEIAWVSVSGEVLFEYKNGIDLYYSPDESTPSEWIADEEAAIEDPEAPMPQASIIEYRNTQASAADTNPDGPSFIAWLEGAFELEIYGKGGQSLDELISLGETLIRLGKGSS
jgi:hypothetical protein